jgi:hypothetical protein
VAEIQDDALQRIFSTPKKNEVKNFCGRTLNRPVNVRSPLGSRPHPTRAIASFFPPCAPNRRPSFSFPASTPPPPRRPPGRRLPGHRSTAVAAHHPRHGTASPTVLTFPSTPVGPPAVVSVSTSLHPRLRLLLPPLAPLLLPLPNAARSCGRRVSLSARTTPASDVVLLPLHVTTAARPLEAWPQATDSTVVSPWSSTFVKGYPG